MGKLLMPSQKKLFNLGGGWHAKETVEGARGLYHESIFRPMRWYDHLFNKSGMAIGLMKGVETGRDPSHWNNFFAMIKLSGGSVRIDDPGVIQLDIDESV